jgi:plastocyanin
VNGNATFVLAVLNGTAFFVLGTCLAVLAMIVSAAGLRSSDAFSSKLAVRGGLLIFAVFVVATATFAVRYSQDEQTDRRAALASEEASQGATQPPAQAAPAAGGPGGTVKLAADPTQIAYVQKSLSSKPGKVTVDFDNPAQISHDVAIAQGSQEIAKSDLITQSKTSVSADLAPGSYDFYCTVPGHREAGMQGTLTVK